jgi:hypothetical protein
MNMYTMQSTGGTLAQTLLEDDFTSLSAWTAGGFTTATELSSNVRLGAGSNFGSITSGAINMSSPTTLLVRAKQYVNDASGKITVKVNSDSITSFLTTSVNQDFTVDIPSKTSTSTLMLYAAGGSGKRVYLDYVKLTTQGAVLTPVSITGYPALVGNVLTSSVSSLTPNTTYYYTVTPQGNSVAVSNQIQVTTLLDDALKSVDNLNMNWAVFNDGIMLRNYPANCTLTLLNIVGKKLEMVKLTATETKLKLNSRGIYLLQLQQGNRFSTYKLIF